LHADRLLIYTAGACGGFSISVFKPDKIKIMKKETKALSAEKNRRVLNFHSWLVNCGNKYLNDTERMDRAILIVEADC
jgi:hypothetical protein